MMTLEPEVLSGIVDEFLAKSDLRPWNPFRSFDWSKLDPARLSDDQRDAVIYLTYVEDHLPDYFARYQTVFPVDQSVAEAEFIHNRELYRFLTHWAHDEELHAHTLFLYQARAGFGSPQQLRQRLAEEGRKPFVVGPLQPVQVFAYATIQEKMTQLFYQQFAAAVAEPVLASILQTLARDEARHFSFFARLMEAYLQRDGAGVRPLIDEVIENFRMPLERTLKGYWRWLAKLSGACGGKHRPADAFDYLRRLASREG